MSKMVRCRFCARGIIDGYTGQLLCDKKQKVMTEKQGKRYRECKDYVFIDCDEIELNDFYMEIDNYKERKPRPKAKGQMKLF